MERSPYSDHSQQGHSPEDRAIQIAEQARQQALSEMAEKRTQIKGWGIDADPKNDPTYPMKKRNNAEHAGYSWERPPQQPIEVEVFHSVERPNITAVFGTAAPPSGVSGAIRRAAFRKSENDYGHWVPLLMADRINMLEGMLEDLTHGRLPNLYEEKGLRADWHYDREMFLAKTVLGVGLAALAIMYLRQERRA
jgi:hypothetical protein